MQDVEKYSSPSRTFRESKRPKKYVGYRALVSQISTTEPSLFEESNKQQVLRDVMLDEYRSIMKNNVWEVVPRLEGKSIVSSMWIYKIKHVIDGSVEKYKERFLARGFSQEIRHRL